MGLLGRRGTSRTRAARFNSWRRSLLGFSAALLPALLIGSQTVAQAPVAAASPSFAFNWAGQPAAPQEWVPAAMNDWDLLESNGGAGDTSLRMGSFQGSQRWTAGKMVPSAVWNVPL